MTQPRRMTDQQRAAHVLLPLVTQMAREFKAEYDDILREKARPRINNDARKDWAEIVAKAEGQAQGAGRVAAMIQALARG